MRCGVLDMSSAETLVYSIIAAMLLGLVIIASYGVGYNEGLRDGFQQGIEYEQTFATKITTSLESDAKIVVL